MKKLNEIVLAFVLGFNCYQTSGCIEIKDFEPERNSDLSLYEDIDEQDAGGTASLEERVNDSSLDARGCNDAGVGDLISNYSDSFVARLNCIERDIDGNCVFRFFTYTLHCWDASSSTPDPGRRIAEYSFYSSIPGIEDLYGSVEAPILCGVAVSSGIYDAYLEVWDDLGNDALAVAKNIISDE